MYYLTMKTALKPSLKLKTFTNAESFIRLREKEISLVDFKFYQKLLVVLISLSTILIFPESPRELENVCEIYNSRKSCNVW
jgi:hypothetical protein